MTTVQQRTPRPLLVPAVIGALILIAPLVSLLQRAPWSTLIERLTTDAVLDAMRVSLIVSIGAAGACLVFGLPLAWVMARSSGRGIAALRILVLLPMVRYPGPLHPFRLFLDPAPHSSDLFHQYLTFYRGRLLPDVNSSPTSASHSLQLLLPLNASPYLLTCTLASCFLDLL